MQGKHVRFSKLRWTDQTTMQVMSGSLSFRKQSKENVKKMQTKQGKIQFLNLSCLVCLPDNI